MTTVEVKQITTNASRTDLDSHADTCFLGKGFLLLEYFGPTCTVTGYDGQHSTKLPVFCAIATYDTHTGKKIILCFNHVLYNAEQDP